MATQARTEFASALNQISAERGIEPKVVLDTIKSAILAAYRKDHEVDEETEYEVVLDPDTGAATIFEIDGKNKKEVTPPGFGRIAAQTAKQVILQRVREAEKDAIIEEYKDKVGVMVTGMVLRFDGKNVIFDIGRGQGYMPPEEQIPSEFYKMNQRMAVYITDIRDTMRGKTIIVSRSSDELVKELFRREVPEVSSGAVEIKAIARDSGHRTKIAVASTQEGVDPVGSCVGQKGVRVQEVINELNNEKIDIIQYSNNIVDFIKAALAPADNLKIEVNDKKKSAVVTVPDDQLSLAIGRGGQNVRLAAKLTGYKIDLEGASGGAGVSATGDEEFEIDQLKLTSRVRNALVKAELKTIDSLQEKKDSLVDIDGVGVKAVEEILAALDMFDSATDRSEDDEKEDEKKEEKEKEDRPEDGEGDNEPVEADDKEGEDKKEKKNSEKRDEETGKGNKDEEIKENKEIEDRQDKSDEGE